MKKHFQNIKLEEPQKEIIKEVGRNKKRQIKTDDMLDRNFLKRVYVRKGIIGSLEMEVYRNEFCYYFISYPVTKNIHLISDLSEFNYYEMGAMIMSKHLKKYDELGILGLDL